MRKRRTAYAALLLALAFPMSVRGETFSGSDGWGVSFDGNQMNSTFTNADIEDTIYLMQPGDTADIHLSLRNDYSAGTDWYMTNQVLQSLEDSQSVAQGGAYSYILTYVDPQGQSDILYSSEEVGGDTINESGEGLHQATNSLEDYFYLDTLGSGEEGEITLQVKLEGETQGNEYQDTLARLQMNFAVELSDQTSSGGGNDTDNPDKEDTRENAGSARRGRVVKTGDTSRVMLFSLLTLGAGALCLILGILRIRENKKAEETGGDRDQKKRRTR